MKAVILDMYGVILKDTGDNFYCPMIPLSGADICAININ